MIKKTCTKNSKIIEMIFQITKRLFQFNKSGKGL